MGARFGRVPDKRQSGRHRFRHTLKVFDHDSGAELGHVGDATTAGVLVVAGAGIEVGRRCRLRVAIPLQDGGTEDVVLESECRWTRQIPESGVWLNGFSIEDTRPKARVIMAFLIRGDIWTG